MTLTLDPQTDRSLQAIQKLNPDEQTMVVKALEYITTPITSTASSLGDAIAGQHFSAQERLELELETLTRHFQHRRQLLETAFTAPQVAKLLGTSRQTPHDRITSQTLLAIKDNGKLRFPDWQFDPAGPDGVLEGLPQVLKALEMSDYAKINWLTRSNPYLEGLTPVQALQQGDRNQVIEQAEAAGAGQWS